MSTPTETYPVQLPAFSHLRVTNGCLRVNGRAFIVESHDGQLVDAGNGYVEIRQGELTRNVPASEIGGSWA